MIDVLIDLIPETTWHELFIAPWTEDLALFGWIALMGFFVTAACGLVGNYLILRRMALVGDAISHSVLPGIAIAFLLAQTRGTAPLFAGALIAGILTTVMIEVIHGRSRIKQDSAIGITFSCFFAFGVVLISLFAGTIDLDADCVLFGEIGYVYFEEPFVVIAGVTLGPPSLVRMAGVAVGTAILIVLFYKELLVSSFDGNLSTSLGINARAMHYALMAALSVVVVSAFESVGAILVIAMLILPGATASLLTHRLHLRLLVTVGFAALSSIGGIHLAIFLDSSIAPAMVVAGCFLFALAWAFSPSEGQIPMLLRRFLQRRKSIASQSLSRPE